MSRLTATAAKPREEESHLPVDAEDEDSSEIDIDVDGDLEKDEAEAELEQLVFGDSAGFRERLKDFSQEVARDEEDGQDITGFEGLDDADVGQALSTEAEMRMGI